MCMVELSCPSQPITSWLQERSHVSMLLGPGDGLLLPRSDVTEEMVGGRFCGRINLDARQDRALSHNIISIRDITSSLLPSPDVGA